jgi:hypothetical protein
MNSLTQIVGVRLLCPLLFLTKACLLPLSAEQIVTVSINEVLKGSDHLAAYRPEFNASIEAEFAEAESVLETLKEIGREVEVLRKKQETEGLSTEETGVLQRFLKLQSDKTKTFLELRNAADKVANERRTALFDLHTDDILKALKEHCKASDILIALPADGSVVLYSKGKLDHSEVVLEKLNSK